MQFSELQFGFPQAEAPPYFLMQGQISMPEFPGHFGEPETEKAVSAKRGRPEAETLHTAEAKWQRVEGQAAQIHFLTKGCFQQMLYEAKHESDPFFALADRFTKMDGYWSQVIQLEEDAFVECQLALDAFDSTCFGKKQRGKFRFIEVFEYNPETKTASSQQLISIRMNRDHSEGEWLSINRGEKIAGRTSKAVAEEISYAMRIKTCYLGDTAQVAAATSEGKIAIRIPLQIMSGKGYYSPPFSLVQTEEPILSRFETPDPDYPFYFVQDAAEHLEALKWLQDRKISQIYEEVLKGKAEDKKKLRSILLRHYPKAAKKKRRDSVLRRCQWTLREFLKVLYDRRAASYQALADYEWAHFHLLDFSKFSEGGTTEGRYSRALEKLYFNQLMSADFSGDF